MVYRERPSNISHTVAWTGRSTGAVDAHRVLPDGCMDLIWMGGQMVVAGPDTKAYLATWRADMPYAALRFGRGVGPRVVGVPARELRDQRIPLDQLWSAAVTRSLEERLAHARAPATVLEAVVSERLRDTRPPDPVADMTASHVGRGHSVERIAERAGLSVRQLHRRCLDAFGYGPKTLARIVRLNRALDIGRAGFAGADAALASGYADQAHLARDVRVLTGTTFAALVGVDEP
ncbi:helix-turn-helix domain-containing protein [Actinobacteria bacterium YIM 96077]|uniref:AraC family transcriptional regulator n=1 Tax=Phytoactinopolyspora halophila TaxID=1981511 RepID=A0A329R3U8_9ACTN|nr:helix-turn-helix domain-containing protein [Actinobacteria bacterium YIM 96077]RAW18172.1 AraC family transcriptional regulator [Phytoactinopolyspora halophila]